MDFPGLYIGQFCCFTPPKPLSKSTLNDFECWFDKFNGYEVFRYIYMNCLEDMIFVLNAQGEEGFSENEIEGYLNDFARNPKYNDRTYLKQKLPELFSEWMEYRTLSLIYKELILVYEEEDYEY
ncbi:MAG: hypothetical protein ACRCXZ_07345 [Patescibacteria group bacterium]